MKRPAPQEAGHHDTTRRELMAFEGLDTGEVALLAEGLHRLREIKVQARGNPQGSGTREVHAA